MTLDLSEVRRIAEEVAALHGSHFEVLSAALAGGGSAYVEVTLMVGGGDQRRRVVIGADRSKGESSLRKAIAVRLRQYLDWRGGKR
jgi:hypothetical protein